jgi:dGTPase
MDHERKILAGEFGRDGANLLGKTAHYSDLSEIKKITKERVFQSDVVLPREIAGYETIAGLLDAMGTALEKHQRGGIGDRERKLLMYIGIDPNVLSDKYKALLAFADYISGMTDSFAIKQYQIVKGIRYR